MQNESSRSTPQAEMDKHEQNRAAVYRAWEVALNEVDALPDFDFESDDIDAQIEVFRKARPEFNKALESVEGSLKKSQEMKDVVEEVLKTLKEDSDHPPTPEAKGSSEPGPKVG